MRLFSVIKPSIFNGFNLSTIRSIHLRLLNTPYTYPPTPPLSYPSHSHPPSHALSHPLSHIHPLTSSSPPPFSLSQAQFGAQGAATASTTLSPLYTADTLTTFATDLYPNPYFRLLDYYGQENITDSTSTITASVVKSNCFDGVSSASASRKAITHIGTVSGKTTVSFVNGRARFSNLTTSCYPGD